METSQALPANLVSITCPHCGVVSHMPAAARRLECVCGTTVFPDSPPLLPEFASEEEQARRVEVCFGCKHFSDSRCSRIDLGCRRTFQRAIAEKEGVCPDGLWGGPSIRRAYFAPAITTMHAIYHVCPLKGNDTWRANLRQLLQRRNVFNGRVIMAIATGEKLHEPGVVMAECRDQSIEYLEIPNDRELREAATFQQLLEAVHDDDEWSATFYAHTKGNSTKGNALGAEYWRNSMYHHLLDHVQVCRDLLLSHPCVGTHKMAWPNDSATPFPTRISNRHRWMFAGTFFWMRNRDVFAGDAWRNVRSDRYGAEAWLGDMFTANQAATVFQPWPVSEYPTPSPYDPRLYHWPRRDT